MTGRTIRILGIDPGLQRTGWGVIAVEGATLAFVAAGTVRTDAKLDLASRLCQIHDGLADVIGQHAPLEAAIESTFVSHDGAATLKLGQARGVGMLAAAKAGLSVAEYAPNAVKKTVTGVGHAQKAQIGAMVRMLLPRASADSADAADALAVAICHASHRGAAGLARMQGGRK
jgi:crossover junction endodeoxyribonuclease RuvC